MKYLVLGGSGFIGLHLSLALNQCGHQVRVFDKSLPVIDALPSEIEIITGDFSNTFSLAEALAGVDVVYHLISTTVPGTSNLDIENDIQSNLIATTNLLQTMVDVGVKKIVFLSSGGTVYGNSNANQISENHPLQPICSYGIVKIAIENYLFMFNQLQNIEYNILRVSNPYGPYQQHLGVQGVIPTFLTNALNDNPITVWGDGSVERDYIYISDLIDACIKAGVAMHNDVFNIGSGTLTSIRQIIDVIEDVSGKKLEIEYLPQRNFDVKSISLDIEHASKTLNWAPQCGLGKGITTYWEQVNK